MFGSRGLSSPIRFSVLVALRLLLFLEQASLCRDSGTFSTSQAPARRPLCVKNLATELIRGGLQRGFRVEESWHPELGLDPSSLLS